MFENFGHSVFVLLIKVSQIRFIFVFYIYMCVYVCIYVCGLGREALNWFSGCNVPLSRGSFSTTYI